MAVRVAIANPKGGVGKSTTTMMLADGLALYHGWRVLVVDMDPQAMASKLLVGMTAMEELTKQRKTLGDLLRQVSNGKQLQLAKYRVSATDVIEIRDSKRGAVVDLIASNRELMKDTRALEDAVRAFDPTHRVDVTLSRAIGAELDRLDANYHAVLFDCPAGPVPLGLAAVRMSRHVLAPTNLEENSFTTLTDFIRLILEDDLALAKTISVHVLISMYQANNPVQRQMLDHIQNNLYGLKAISRPVPHTTAIQRAEMHPGPGAFRSAREKYEGALGEVEALARAVAERIAKREK